MPHRMILKVFTTLRGGWFGSDNLIIIRVVCSDLDQPLAQPLASHDDQSLTPG